MSDQLTDFPQYSIANPRNLPASAGWQWINKGFRYVISSKLNWVVMLSMLGAIFTLLRYLPPILQFSIIVIFPIFASGIASVCNDLERGQRITPANLFKGFSNPNLGNIVRYGLLIFLLIILTQIISSLIMSSMGYTPEMIEAALLNLQSVANPGFGSILESDVLGTLFWVSVISLTPILAIQFLAPIILTFTRLNAMASVVLALSAVLKNLTAVIVYIIILVVFFFALIYMFNALASVVLPATESSAMISSVIFLAIFFMVISLFVALVYSSAYVAFKNIFLQEEI